MQFFLLFPASCHLFQIQIVPNDHFAAVILYRILPMVKTNQFRNGHLVVIVYDPCGENGGDIVDLDDDLLDGFFFFADDHIQDHDRDHSA